MQNGRGLIKVYTSLSCPPVLLCLNTICQRCTSNLNCYQKLIYSLNSTVKSSQGKQSRSTGENKPGDSAGVTPNDQIMKERLHSNVNRVVSTSTETITILSKNFESAQKHTRLSSFTLILLTVGIVCNQR